MGDGVGEDGCAPMSPTVAAAEMACGKYTCDEQTAKDPAAALTWQRVLPVTYDGCPGRYSPESGVPGDACTWEQAKAYCSGLGLASGGWRLPTREELLSIVDMTRADPSINLAAFPNTPSQGFWSDSTYAGSSEVVWRVYFGDGNSITVDADNTHRVRCVR
jgi:hypothetical protein